MLQTDGYNLYSALTENDLQNDFGNDILQNIFQSQDLDSICKYYDIEDMSNLIKPRTNDLFIIHINARSIVNNLDFLKILISSLHSPPDIIGISESWLSEEKADRAAIDGYKSYHVMRPSEAYGGVTFFVKNNINSHCVEKLSFVTKDIEVLTICIPSSNNQKKDTILSCLYRPSSKHKRVRSFTNVLTNLLSDPLFTDNKVFIMGDWNINLIEHESHEPTQSFLSTMQSLSYFPLISRATRFPELNQRGKPSLLDNIFTNNLPHAITGIIKYKISDHLPIFALVSQSDVEKFKIKVQFRDFSLRNRTTFLNDLSNIRWEEILIHNDNNVNKALFIDKLMIEYNKNFPIKTKTVSNKSLHTPWITRGIIKSCKTKFDLYRKAKAGLVSMNEYKIYKNKLLNLIRKSKKQYFYNYFAKYKNNLKNVWKKLNSLTGKTKNNHTCNKININGKISTNKKDIANAFNNFFSTIGQNLNNELPETAVDPNSYLSGIYPNPMVIPRVTELEVASIVKSLPNKPCSVENFSSEIIKENSELIAVPLTILFNKSLQSGSFPDQFKHATVIPILKKGSASELSNYRPISLLSIFSKIFEKIMKKYLTSYLVSNNIISEHQYGFQSGKSTFDAQEEFSRFIYENLDKGKIVISLFLDYKKAFDCVPHSILLEKLHHYGIRGNLLNWFKCYLSGRSQVTKIDKNTSQRANINIGLPQGSVLGPLLFNIFINDLANVSRVLKLVKFCDDSTLYLTGRRISEMIDIVNSEMLLISQWCLANRMSLNTDKTVAMIFSNRRIRTCPPIVLKNGYNYDLVKRVDNIKFLGIYYDEHMKFKKHISHLCNTLSRIAGMFYRLSSYLPTHILKKVYDAHVNSRLSYNTPIWACNYSNNIKPVLQVQKKIIRIITRSDYLAHTKPLFKKSKTLNITDLNRFYLGKLYHKNPDKYITPLRFRHHHNTRNIGDLRPPRFHTTLALNSFLVLGPNTYNDIPDDIKSLRSPISFKKKLKEYLLSLD